MFSVENIQAKLDALQIEIKRLTVKRQQVEFEIGRIEHLHLKQRFQEISARLLTQRLEIEHQVCMNNVPTMYINVSAALNLVKFLSSKKLAMRPISL